MQSSELLELSESLLKLLQQQQQGLSQQLPLNQYGQFGQNYLGQNEAWPGTANGFNANGGFANDLQQPQQPLQQQQQYSFQQQQNLQQQHQYSYQQQQQQYSDALYNSLLVKPAAPQAATPFPAAVGSSGSVYNGNGNGHVNGNSWGDGLSEGAAVPGELWAGNTLWTNGEGGAWGAGSSPPGLADGYLPAGGLDAIQNRLEVLQLQQAQAARASPPMQQPLQQQLQPPPPPAPGARSPQQQQQRREPQMMFPSQLRTAAPVNRSFPALKARTSLTGPFQDVFAFPIQFR